MQPLTTFTHTFEGKPLVTVTWQGRPAWIARHIGERLGYSHGGKRLPNKILGEWADEFIAERDYTILSGDDLAAFKELPGAEGVAASTHARLLLLFESGLHLALIKTRKKLGRDLRQFLAREVMPQIVRTGAYQPTGGLDAALVLVSLPAPVGPSLAERREARLAQQADTRARWVDFCDRRLQVQALHRTIDRLEGTRLLSAADAATLELTAAEIALDADLEVLKPERERWVSAGQIARRWGASKERVARVIRLLGLQGDEVFSRRVVRRYGTTDSGEARRVFSWVYNGAAEALIEEMLDAMGFEPVRRDAEGSTSDEAAETCAREPKDAA